MYSGALPGVFPLKFVEVWPIRELIAGLPAITIRRRVKPQVSFKPLPIAARVTVILFGIMGLAAILYAFLWQRHSLQATFWYCWHSEWFALGPR
jgi:hypothetical protein